jgi:hypothetical protein
VAVHRVSEKGHTLASHPTVRLWVAGWPPTRLLQTLKLFCLDYDIGRFLGDFLPIFVLIVRTIFGPILTRFWANSRWILGQF